MSRVGFSLFRYGTPHPSLRDAFSSAFFLKTLRRRIAFSYGEKVPEGRMRGSMPKVKSCPLVTDNYCYIHE